MPEILVLLICHRWALHLWRIEPEQISEAASNDGGKQIFNVVVSSNVLELVTSVGQGEGWRKETHFFRKR